MGAASEGSGAPVNITPTTGPINDDTAAVYPGEFQDWLKVSPEAYFYR